MIAWMQHVGGVASGHDHSPVNIATMLSSDDGYTWSDYCILADNNPGDTNVHYPLLLGLHSGDILMYYIRYHEIKPAAPLNFTSFMCKSSDDGQTWTDPVAHHIIGRPMIQLSTGRILMSNQKVAGQWCGQGDHQIAGGYYSDDDGQTWTESQTFADLPLRGAMEPHIVELRDGRLMMVLRTQIGAIFKSYSCDGGANWSKPQTTGIRGPESMRCLKRIPTNGDLILIWNHSEFDPEYDHDGKRTPLTVAISKDDGESFENFKDIETDSGVEFTNPSCHFTSSGKVIITYLASPMEDPNPPGLLGRGHMPMKAAIADLDWFYQ
jgi:sialidase-1